MFGKKKKKEAVQEENNDKPDTPKSKNDKNAKENISTKKEKGGRKGFPFKKVIITLILLVSLCGGGYYGYLKFSPSDGYRQIELSQVTLPEKIIRFTYDRLNEIYESIVDLNSEITIIDQEIARIDTIEKEYPDQNKITESEKKIWDKARQNLAKHLSKLEKGIEAIYVTFLVNAENGNKLIEEKRAGLDEGNKAALAPAEELTKRLKKSPDQKVGKVQGLIDKVKGIF